MFDFLPTWVLDFSLVDTLKDIVDLVVHFIFGDHVSVVPTPDLNFTGDTNETL